MVIKEIIEMKNVHTEHCCVKHGCKYGEDDICPVVNGQQPQSYPCEYCDMDGIDPTKDDPKTRIYNFETGHYYRYKNRKEEPHSLLYVMGLMKDENGNSNLICNVYLPENFALYNHCGFRGIIKGFNSLPKSKWKEISKESFENLKRKYTKQYEKLTFKGKK